MPLSSYFVSVAKRVFEDGKPTARYRKELGTPDRTTLLFGAFRFHRAILLPVCFVLEMIFGTTSAWSVYCKALSLVFHSQSSALESVYSVLLGFLGVGNLLSNPLIVRHGPRTVFSIGCTLFMLSNLLLAIAIKFRVIPMAFVGIGVIGGFADGISFPVPLLVLQKYFPDKRGMAAGVAVGGYGAGTLMGSFFHGYLLKKSGQDVSTGSIDRKALTFVGIGLVYFIIHIFGASLLRFPSISFAAAKPLAEGTPCENSNNDDMLETKRQAVAAARAERIEKATHLQFPSLSSALRHYSFAVFAAMFALNSLGAFVLQPRIASFAAALATSGGSKISPISVETLSGINGIFNVVGRLSFGMLFDLLGKASTRSPAIYILTQTMQLCCLGLILVAILRGSFTCYVAGLWLTNLAFGGAFGPVTGLLVQLFGEGCLGNIFSIFFGAWAILGLLSGMVIPFMVNESNSNPEKYLPLVYLLFPCMLAGLVLALMQFMYVVRRTRRILCVSGPHNAAVVCNKKSCTVHPPEEI